jgi:hypothetical protein
MISARTARRRARKGAEFFDEVKPGWFVTIDAENLNIATEDLCAGAQVLGNGDYATTGLGHSRWAYSHGFVAQKGTQHYLNMAWREEITKRFDAMHAELGTDTVISEEMQASKDRHPSNDN